MTTNQKMQRRMGSISIYQRTKDGFFDATSLLREWNSQTGMQKQVAHYFELSATQEFVSTIMQRENLKERKSVFIIGRGKGGGTWMHPLLFIDFAMWINPSYRYDVLRFVFDQMLKFRNDAGEAYKEMSAAIATIVDKNLMQQAMKKVAEAINYIVFAAHYPNIRNDHGSEDEMRELFELERRIANAINDGFISDFDSLIRWLRQVWSRKQVPKVFKQ